MAIDIDQLLNYDLNNADANTQALLAPYKGAPFILYFYPKDSTPGCTQQACELQTDLALFKTRGITVVGASKDSALSHGKFAEKYALQFPLISDVDGALCQTFGVWKEKKNYGKTYFGIERSTFYIDDCFIIRHIWRKVKVSGHWNFVLNEIK
jgi:peroxiredoxin